MYQEKSKLMSLGVPSVEDNGHGNFSLFKTLQMDNWFTPVTAFILLRFRFRNMKENILFFFNSC